jgi:hypothetical protein
MKGVVVPAAGAAFEVVTNLETPKPGMGEILVKSLATGINPMFVIKYFVCLNCKITMFQGEFHAERSFG